MDFLLVFWLNIVMRLKKKTLLLWVSVTVIFSIIGLSPSVSTAKEEYIEGSVDVIDGGATRVGDEVIKLYNVIAPSARQKCRKGSMPWLCGAAAHKHLAELTRKKISEDQKEKENHLIKKVQR